MMRRRQRKAMPLIALLTFEVLAIIGLQALGSSPKMQIPWAEFGTWIQTATVDEIAAPVIRLFALVVAYWMFASTALFAIAQASRIPAAIRATSTFTLPSVRRVVDGAVAVSIVTTSFVGISATAASATTTQPAITISASQDLTIPSGSLGQSVGSSATNTAELAQGAGGQDSVPTPGLGRSTQDTQAPAPATTRDNNQNDSAPTPTTPNAAPGESQTPADSDPTTTTTTAAPTTTTAAPTTTTSTSEAPTTTTEAPSTTAPAAPTAGNQWVPTPRLDVPASTTTTTAAPQAAPSAAPEVKGAQEHRVTPGDNLWTISRDALASSTGKSASDLTEAQIRDYWLKVIDANRDHLRSGDPHWIFPGEVISLPSAS